jgi:predicted Ser/Thr protein kinase
MYKDAFCAIVEKGPELPKGTKVVLLHYRLRSGDDAFETSTKRADGQRSNPHRTEKEFLDEVRPFLNRQSEANNVGLAPKVYTYGFVPKVGGFAVTEYVQGESLAKLTEENRLTPQILTELYKGTLILAKLGIYQDDKNISNYLWNNKIIFIDDLSEIPATNRTPVKSLFEFVVDKLVFSVPREQPMRDVLSETIRKFKRYDFNNFWVSYRADASSKNDFTNELARITSKFAGGPAAPDAPLAPPPAPPAEPAPAPRQRNRAEEQRRIQAVNAATAAELQGRAAAPPPAPPAEPAPALPGAGTGLPPPSERLAELTPEARAALGMDDEDGEQGGRRRTRYRIRTSRYTRRKY